MSGFVGAGMTAMVAIIITGRELSSMARNVSLIADYTQSDLAPLSKVAVLRSHVNLAAVAGRSAGGPIGGLLLDNIGWRW